ncbi:hypothetical protein L210DRAFT_3639971 [Boletus edulis BED1]|uniref:Uncharacterized protein n=1 Tax=Boletus edulis BED1 TaxID=1328754 RepID=A0AAD4C7H5_BOLED|nr:hypothetical protein L210DRAFT_3639971 [Boletus edulis BED1]
MIHLDRSHHHDLDQTQKQNLILSRDHDAPLFDWDDLSHTPNAPFFHDTLHPRQPLSPHNIHLSSDTTTSPAHPPHDIHDDKSSSLSPAPDSGSPQPNASLPHSRSHPPATDKQEPDLTVEGTLTPLTELSPAPDLDDPPEDTKDVQDDPKDSSHSIPSSASQVDPTRDRRVHPTVRINGTSSSPTSSAGSPSRPFSTPDCLPFPSGLSAPSTGQPSSDLKVVRILEINAELFKVCLEFQVRGIPISDSRFQQYAMRLHVNLTWLAAAADQRHNSLNVTLPIMEPPAAVEFVSMVRIHQLYADISTIFAKDVARRQLLNATHQGSPTAPSAAPNGALKRTRPDDLPDVASKRRDMGENKPQVTQAPHPVMSLASAASHPNPASTFSPTSQSNIVMSTAPAMPHSPRVSSPAMPPPSATPSLPFAATEASIAASTRARARELQIQQAREQQLRQAQMQQMQAGRHMSPPSTSQQVPQGVTSGQSNTAFGLQTQYPSSILQNPNHPLMQYMIQQMPQFTSLPPQQQMQKLQVFQNVIAQRQQQQQQQQQQQHQQQLQLQNPQVATPQRNHQMVSMSPNTSIPTMSNGALNAGGGLSPVSPLAQQSPVMSQQVINPPAQNGMFAFGQGHTNPGMDPRMAGSNFSSQMQGGMPNNMNVNQQRQFIHMQQQQMRNTNGGMNAVPNMMSSQQHAYAMAQRMAQAGPSQSGNNVGGSPMSAPAGDQFPALRSNSTIPGIARSARSPSDGVHSPMTPRAPSRLSQQPQLQQNDYSQAMMQHPHVAMAQNPATFNPQVQNPNWPQSGQQPMQQQMGMVAGQMNGFSMNSPNGAGVGGGFFGSAPSPSNSNWQQHPQAMTGSYPYGQSMGQHVPSDQGRLSHMTMSIPQNMSPMADGSGAPGEYDIFSYTGS